MYISRLEAGTTVEHAFRAGFGAYLFLIEGELALNGQPVGAGEAAIIRNEERLAIRAREPSELIMVEVEV